VHLLLNSTSRILDDFDRGFDEFPGLPKFYPGKRPDRIQSETLQPHVRSAGDGTYEVLVPLVDCDRDYIFPYCFQSEEDCESWIHSRKGSEKIERIRSFAKQDLDYLDYTLAPIQKLNI
jgi:hypothetical protein